MKSLIIISPLIDELHRIRDLWLKKDNRLKIADIGSDRLTIDFGDGYVLVDFIDNGRIFYDVCELNENVLNNFYFYSIIYSDKETLIDFVFGSSFSEECFIDNDHGEIVALNSVTREMLLCIAE